ncbi:MAG: TolC family protein, partial [Saprospiraceae bacterium]
MNFTLKILIFICIANSTFAQNMLTLTAAELAVLQNNPQVKATAWDVKAKKYAEKGALNLSNPEINLESPTGEFYTLGVSQSFELPRVYSRQKQLAKAETALAKAGLSVTENDMRYALRSLYLAAQVSHYKTEQWQKRDTLYKQIAATAVRQFEAGEIDFLQKTMAENEAGKVYQERLAAEMETTSLLVQLKLLTGFTDFTDLEPFSTDSLNILFLPQDQDVVNPSIIYEQQAAKVEENQIGMAKSRVLPNFSLGYMNQGA